ncbi:tetratricopeptide repeat protein [Limibaculum sp. FT325]|uniref:tetratricopeptide repeat protein n=1 Tax=Thermohalobaculum sediminis TaxID=2939436 RepID=UPI0020BEAF45|nr:tetratricopeptide repeat protein [Limibaculum sediminis]MCL5779076.1 tetratricopeptide repeat protein [Limibaculum sediminis]
MAEAGIGSGAHPRGRATGSLAASLAAIHDRALSHHRAGELREAAGLYRRLLAAAPGNAQVWTNYGALLRRQGRLGPAIAAHRRALALDPGMEGARVNLANALADDGRYAEAEALRRALMAEAPRNPERLRDLAAALRGLGRHEEAIALIDAAEAGTSADDRCRLQRGLARLMLGRWREGFADFECRYADGEVSLPDDAPWPRWQGEPVAGKRLLVLPEQGFGDAIVMCRFLPGLVAMGAEVTMVVKPPLRRLLAGLPGIRMADAARKSEAYDFYTPNMSLPHLVGMADGIPPPPPLAIPADSRARAAALAAPFLGHFRVGVVWTGSQTFRANHRRSTMPESFLGLAQVPGVQLFSLYKGPAHGDFIDSGMAGLIVDACGADRDFADTAAVIEAMDLMITTDTAVVHVAASLGKPVWNLLSHEGFWLYGRGEATPWYPSMRLWRQERPGDWDGVFARVEAALRGHPGLADRRGG